MFKLPFAIVFLFVTGLYLSMALIDTIGKILFGFPLFGV